MSGSEELQVVVAPLLGGRGACCLHRPDDPYVEDVWLPVLGPASYMVWRHLARLTTRSPRTTITIAELAASTGLGRPQAHQSPINRALRRLARFDLVHIDGERLLVRAALPFVTVRQLARLDPAIQAIHRRHRDASPRSAS
jgi:hypothetical protein